MMTVTAARPSRFVSSCTSRARARQSNAARAPATRLNAALPPRMSPAPSPVRLRAEALRAFAGLWLVVVSLFAAPAFYRWSELALPQQPAARLIGAFALAALACVGLALVTRAGIRTFLAMLAPSPRASIS